MAKKLPVEFVTNPSFLELSQLYQEASIYWHAAGYGVDPIKHPESVEHFGITTVESMSAGCVPVVIQVGGQPEIVTAESGLLFSSIDDLVEKTIGLINNPEKMSKISKAAIHRAQYFSESSFAQQVTDLVK